MKLSDIKEILQAEVLCGQEWLDREICTACGSDLMSDVLAFSREKSVLLTGLTNAQVIRTAEMSDSLAVLFVRGKKPPAEVIELAEANELPLLTTNHMMYDACGLLYKSGLKGKILEKNSLKNN